MSGITAFADRWLEEKFLELGPACSVAQAAELLGVSRAQVYDLIAEGKFPVRVIRVGEAIRLPTAQVLALVRVPDTTEAGSGAMPPASTTSEKPPRPEGAGLGGNGSRPGGA